MNILHSKQPTFRYHWKWGPNPSPYLAASRVIVLDLFNSEFVERCNASFVKLSAPAKSGGLTMQEMGSSWTREANTLLREALLGNGVKPFEMMNDLEPALVRLHDQVRYHHDMPLWSSILGAWMLDGPERVLRFPLMDLEVPFRPGTVVLFDTAQPHGLLRPGSSEYETCADADDHPISMVSFSCFKKETMKELLGVQTYDIDAHAHIRHTEDQYKVCDRTGAIAFR